MANINISELIEMFGEEQSPNSIIKTTKRELTSYQVFFDEDVGEAVKYRELIHALYMADENDEFNFFINSNGGNLDACMAIVEAMGASHAHIRGIINGNAHSAASIIALSCKEVVVTNSASMMVHTASYGSGGSTNNVKAHTDFFTVYINKILDTTYTGFLTPSELIEVKKGVEMWFSSEDIVERLKNKQKYIEAKTAKVSDKEPKKTVKKITTK